MCTAIAMKNGGLYFGRNLDLDFSYGEQICILPRKFPLAFRRCAPLSSHYAMIGMATVIDGVPLLYDAANEHGLCMAGLNFPDNAYYCKETEGKDNVCQFELIPWLLGQCKSVREAKTLLGRLNITDIPFSNTVPTSPMHWMLSDADGSVVIEQMRDGLHIHENPVGVLTNNPPFEYQLFNLNNYRRLNSSNGENTFSAGIALDEYCQGLGGIGLPGDVSSMSRFVRAAFNKENSHSPVGEVPSVSQFFHLLSSVEMLCGVCRVPSGEYDITVYSSCISAEHGRYYYTTYTNRCISCVDMRKTELDGDTPYIYPLELSEKIIAQN